MDDESEGLARTVFVGEFARSVDGNGRLALPAIFRDDLTPRCYVSADRRGCVAITTTADFEEQANQVLADIKAGLRPPSAQLGVGSSTNLVNVDKQARITLDESLRKHAGIAENGEAIVVGALNQLQIWRPSRYRTLQREYVVEEPARVWIDDDEEADA